MMAWPPFRMRIFIASNAWTSGVKVTPTFSNAGRPMGKLSSSTHCRNGSQVTGTGSVRPKSAAMARSRGPVAGVMRSTMPPGKATFAATHAAKIGSDSWARPTTAACVTWPLPGRLSQDMTVKGATPAALRRRRAARIAPKAVPGREGSAASARMSAARGSNLPVAAST